MGSLTNDGKRWEFDEYKKLVETFCLGDSLEVLAKKLTRRVSAVEAQLQRMGILKQENPQKHKYNYVEADKIFLSRLNTLPAVKRHQGDAVSELINIMTKDGLYIHQDKFLYRTKKDRKMKKEIPTMEISSTKTIGELTLKEMESFHKSTQALINYIALKGFNRLNLRAAIQSIHEFYEDDSSLRDGSFEYRNIIDTGDVLIAKLYRPILEDLPSDTFEGYMYHVRGQQPGMFGILCGKYKREHIQTAYEMWEHLTKRPKAE